MNDKQVITWLIHMSTHVAELHQQSKKSRGTNAGPNFDDDSIPFTDEAFAAWMGWRGEEESTRCSTWPVEELVAERREHLTSSKRELKRENEELRACLRSIQALIVRRFSQP